MKCNIGWIDRTVRFLLGAPTAVSYLYVRHFNLFWARTLFILGVSLIATAIFRWCPLSAALGISTLTDEEAPE